MQSQLPAASSSTSGLPLPVLAGAAGGAVVLILLIVLIIILRRRRRCVAGIIKLLILTYCSAAKNATADNRQTVAFENPMYAKGKDGAVVCFIKCTFFIV